MRTRVRVMLATFAVWTISGSVEITGGGPLEAQAPEGTQKAVLVTGASSGIGRTITELLASRGYFVYAGARKEEDLRDLNKIENVQSVRLDVTKQDEIDAAVNEVVQAGRGLYGLVNNAGVAVLAPLIEAEEEDLHFQFDVNVLGPYRITKAFAPLIMEAQGRITTIGSVSGIVAGLLSGPYAMSKHAMEAFTDALAAEMERFGVKVSLVEPGRYRSSMSANVLRRMQERNQTGQGSLFEAEIRGMIEYASGDESRFPEPIDVAEAVIHALFDEDPKRRYMVVPSQAQARGTIRRAIEKVVELNEGHQFSFDRETLISMLDAALAR